MTDRLRGALAEIAETAPVAHVPNDTFRRGRRARRRSQAYAVLAAVVVLLAGAGVVVQLQQPTPPQVSSSDTVGALPDHVYAVPTRLQGLRPDGSWSGPVETDLAVGQASVAFLTPAGLPVVVTASDGHYHLLDLPGPIATRNAVGQPDETRVLALSPDGTRLAYPSILLDPETGRALATRVNVVDLTDGRQWLYGLDTAGRKAELRQVGWSPDGQWLVWTGLHVAHWDERGMAATRPFVGARIHVGADEVDALPGRLATADAVAIDDRGRVATATTDHVYSWDGTTIRRSSVALDSPVPGAVTTGDGSSMIVGSSSPWVGATAVRTATGRTAFEANLDPAQYDAGASVTPLSPPTHGSVIALLAPYGEADEVQVGSLRTRASMDTFGDPVHVITRVDRADAESLTIATALLRANPRTAHFPPPEWPWSAEHKLAVVGGSVAGVLALAWLAFVGVRRRRRA